MPAAYESVFEIEDGKVVRIKTHRARVHRCLHSVVEIIGVLADSARDSGIEPCEFVVFRIEHTIIEPSLHMMHFSKFEGL